VDLITNSSTEIYVQASQNTIGAIKRVVDAVLVASGSTSKADDLFEFDLIVKVDNPKPYDQRGPDEGWTIDVSVDSTEGKAYLYEHEDDYEHPAKIYMSVKAKQDNLSEAAKILSNLTGLFELSAIYN
jgi:hypothetical protein